MTKTQLADFASANGIEVSTSMTKNAMIETIKEALGI